uniref:N-acetylneuraminate lyase n=1 Tax=Lutzomyia longipalpis TaxID=7200 RepID=A0A7G3AFE5_LUTLO
MSVRAFNFRGLMAPTFTAFKDNPSQSVNYEVIDPYAKWLKDKRIKAVLVNGTSGEGMSLNVAERKATAEEWQKACKKYEMTLMVQVGGAPFVDVAELAKHAEQLEVDAILCLPELYFKPKNEKDLVEYFKNVAKYCPRTPLLYYHIPSFSGVDLSMPKFLNLAEKEIKNFIGIKYTSGDLAQGSACLKDNRFIFLGADTILCGALAQGFDSSIMTTLNIYPEFAIEILESMKKGDIVNARKKQKELSEIVERILQDDLAQGSACLKDNRFIFLGADTILCGALAQGFDSSIMTTLNIYPEFAIEILESMKKGDIVNARKKQKELSEIVERILQDDRKLPSKEFISSSQSINYAVIDPYAKWLKNKGIQGVLVNGTTGEGMSLSVPERQGVAEEWQKACKKYGMTLMVQVGGAPFVDVAELAKHAEELEVDAILCLPELYFRPKNEKDLVRYIGNVSKYCSRTPLLYYHFPMMSKVEVSMPKFLDLAEQEIENIVGIKFSSPDLAEGSACLKSNRFIFLGNNMIFCGALAQGFDCSIMTSLNICPELAIEIFQSIKKGRHHQCQCEAKGII